jgi:activator of HSP90 ATPase
MALGPLWDSTPFFYLCLNLPRSAQHTKNYMETIQQSVIIDCPAHAVYQFFTDSREHTELTKALADIEPRIGGNFSSYNGELQGQFTRLVPDEIIVMLWRSTMPDWPEEHFAVLSLELFQSGEGTTVEMTLGDVPGECLDAVEEGWQDYYWLPLQRAMAF